MLRLVSTATLALVLAAPAWAAGSAEVAALQVGLRAQKIYTGAIDGLRGAETDRAIRLLQQKAGLPVDGVVGSRTRAALGRFGKPTLGSRVLARGMSGWDVAELQFRLAWRGFPSGPFDGSYGARTANALVRFQACAGLAGDGVLGRATLGALRAPLPRSPIALSRPMEQLPTEFFGPRGNRFHTGVDFPAPSGSPVGAAGAGRVAYAGWHPGGWGYVVTIAHGSGVRTLYAHLSRVDVRLGQHVSARAQIGLVGATGHATGPHLHFEVRLRGAAVDPSLALR